MRTVDPEKHAMQRRAILQAATACFARDGFHKTSTEMICAAAGTSSGKLFHYFPNKKALIVAVAEDQIARTAAEIALLRALPAPTRALAALIDGILDLAGDATARRLILEIAAEAGRDADIAALSAAGDRVLTEGLTNLLTAAIAQGAASPPAPVDHASRFLMALIDGIFSRVSVDPAFDPAAEREAFQSMVRAALGINQELRHA